MSNSLLYFPYIDIPQNDWTIKSILYWDHVGIIVPPDFSYRPEQYGRYTIELLQTDLVQEIYPDRYTREVKNFDKAFFKLIDQKAFPLEKRQEKFRNGQHAKIHGEKFGREIFKRLIKLKLAEKKDWNWYHVERRTARLLMTYLATVLGKAGDFIPATDDPKNLDTSLSQESFSFRKASIRQRLIDDLIPYPIEPNLTKLRKFKDKYHEELRSFRVLLEHVAFEISTYKSPKKQDRKHELVLKEINDKKAKIVSDLNQSKAGLLSFGTICGTVSAAIALATENKPLALFSFANAIYSAFQGYGDQDVLAKDYSYLALIDRHMDK